MPEIEADLNITHADAGSMFFYISIGYFITLLGSGWVAASLNHRRTIILSSVVLGLALICTAFSGGLRAIRITLLLLGAAAGLYLPSGIATLTAFDPASDTGGKLCDPRTGSQFGFYNCSLIFGIHHDMVFLAQSSCDTGGYYHFSRNLVCLLQSQGSLYRCSSRIGPPFNFFLTKPAFWIMVILFSLGIAGTLGVYTMLPLYLVTEQAIDRDYANTLLSFSRILSLFMSFAGGWASDRFGPRNTLVIVFLFSGVATMAMGAVSDRWILWAIFLQPMLAVCFFPRRFCSTLTNRTGRNQ